MEIEYLLKKVGLTTQEIKVYLVVVRLGESDASSILRGTNIHRPGVYDSLERLLNKGLIGQISKKGKRYFFPASPEKLKEIVKDKEREFDKINQEVDEAVSYLKEKTEISQKKQEAKLYKGVEGIRTVLNEMISQKGEILTIGAYDENSSVFKKLSEYILPAYHKKRIESKIKSRFIFPMGSVKRAYELAKLKLTEVRILPSEFVSSVGIQIYSGKVAIIVWSEDPTALIIEDKEVNKNQRDYFEFLWKASKPLKSGA